jgi:tetratricopeptide (TPR) repeat protein
MTTDFPDPNAPERIGMSPEIMKRNLNDAWQSLELRRERGEIDNSARDQLYQAKVKELIELIPATISDDQAWMYGDVYRDAKMWPEAVGLYKRAVTAAKTEDRRVNDLLRLAQAQAAVGSVQEAAASVRATFDAPPNEKAPILPAVLYEVAPAGRGKGQDALLADMLVESIKQHMQTLVDPETEAGQAFLAARGHHVKKAWTEAVSLYEAGGQRDKAREALKSFEQEMARTASV